MANNSLIIIEGTEHTREYLANERTFLAGVRTSLGIVGLEGDLHDVHGHPLRKNSNNTAGCLIPEKVGDCLTPSMHTGRCSDTRLAMFFY